jgi:hypothetical protein
MLRKYGVFGRGLTTAAWALGVEVGVTLVDTIAGRDLAAARGRLSGWKAAAGRHARIPDGAVNRGLGLREGLRRRLGRCANARESGGSPRPGYPSSGRATSP